MKGVTSPGSVALQNTIRIGVANTRPSSDSTHPEPGAMQLAITTQGFARLSVSVGIEIGVPLGQ